MQVIQLFKNKDNGLDVIFNEGGNTVKIETGDRKNSLNYWKEMQSIANRAIDALSKPQPAVHIVLISRKGKGSVIHRSYRGK